MRPRPLAMKLSGHVHPAFTMTTNSRVTTHPRRKKMQDALVVGSLP